MNLSKKDLGSRVRRFKHSHDQSSKICDEEIIIHILMMYNFTPQILKNNNTTSVWCTFGYCYYYVITISVHNKMRCKTYLLSKNICAFDRRVGALDWHV